MQICLYMNKPKQNLQEIKSRQRIKNKKTNKKVLMIPCLKNAPKMQWWMGGGCDYIPLRQIRQMRKGKAEMQMIER